MDAVKNLVEYYDELFPVSDAQRIFFESYISQFSAPAKFLSIGCGTGIFEHRLAKDAIDVTAIEAIRELLDSATRRYRNQLMSLRYFQMSTLEMTKFLGKKFYNIISCLN
ncbi:MAG: methyltransferase domain-containing protein, partial [Treponemataceae bacterium]|nr:methyltransferase domain-containing protein [Treponemataceae bacterium]